MRIGHIIGIFHSQKYKFHLLMTGQILGKPTLPWQSNQDRINDHHYSKLDIETEVVNKENSSITNPTKTPDCQIKSWLLQLIHLVGCSVFILSAFGSHINLEYFFQLF